MSTLAEENASQESERHSRSYRPVAGTLNQCVGPFTHRGGIVANFRAKITGQQPDEAQAHQHIRRVLQQGRHVHGWPLRSGRWLSPADLPKFDDLGQPGHGGRCGRVLIGGEMRIAQIEIVPKVMVRADE
jgi:hypothetical protein